MVGVGVGFDFTGVIKLMDQEDMTQAYEISFNEGSITGVASVSSGYEWKSVEICEDGVATSYEFLIKS